jgi:hypothetical protein
VRQYRAVRKDRENRDAWEGVKAWQSELEKQRQFLKPLSLTISRVNSSRYEP